MKPYDSIGVGVLFAPYVFTGLPGASPSRIFDHAMDYACEIMQVSHVDVVTEDDWVRFIPQLTGGEI